MQYRPLNISKTSKKSPISSSHVTPERRQQDKSASKLEADFKEQKEYAQNLKDLNTEYMKIIQQ